MKDGRLDRWTRIDLQWDVEWLRITRPISGAHVRGIPELHGGGWNILDACSAPRNALGGDALNRLAVIGGQSGKRRRNGVLWVSI